MSSFSLSFESKELEEKYQLQQQKYINKSVNHLICILSIGEIIPLFDSIFHVQYILILFTFSLVIFNGIILYLSRKKRIDVKMIIFYLNSICITGIIIQIIYIQFQQEFQFTQYQIFAQLDIIHQFITLFNFGQSHIISSIIYILFVISRVYIQISFGYTNLSIAFAFFSLFYILEQYQKAKQRRKQFLKSQRNKLLEQLIKDFIDERVCIIQKDEDNVKFIPIIINNKLQELTQDINQILKQLKLKNQRESLQQYLYRTIKDKEMLLCSYKKQIYEVTYQRFIFKKCQIFIKIKEICYNQSQTIDFKELYLRQLNEFQIIKQNSYNKYLSQHMKKAQIKLFVHWFKKYPLRYQTKIQSMDIYKLLMKEKLEIIQSNLIKMTLNTDKLLLKLLLKSLKTIIQNRQIKLYRMNYGIQIQIYGIITNPIRQDLICFINQILFHIGVGNIVFHKAINKIDLITVKLLHHQDEKFE